VCDVCSVEMPEHNKTSRPTKRCNKECPTRDWVNVWSECGGETYLCLCPNCWKIALESARIATEHSHKALQ
jgi:hypothetical protein